MRKVGEKFLSDGKWREVVGLDAQGRAITTLCDEPISFETDIEEVDEEETKVDEKESEKATEEVSKVKGKTNKKK